MKIRGIDHLVLTVADPARSIEFYTGLLGLEARGNSLRGGNCRIDLRRQPNELQPASARTLPGCADFCLALNERPTRVRQQLTRCHVPLVAGPLLKASAAGESCSLYFRDPDGNLVELACGPLPEPDNSGKLELREATRPEELTTIAILAQEIWPGVYSGIFRPGQFEYMMKMMYAPEVMHRDRDHGVHFILLTDGEMAIGFSAYGPVRGRDCELHKLYLTPRYQHRGLGARLITHASDWARKEGAERLFLHVNKNNAPAIRAYLRNGFKAVDSVTTDIGGGYVMDDYIMARELNPPAANQK